MGPNGAGKTNLLEAVHYGTQGFSPRTRRDARSVRFEAASARVRTDGRRGTGVVFRTDVTLEAGGGKRITLDGAPAAGSDELRRHFPVLAFTPDRLAVVKGGPVVRRTYLDRMLGRLNPARAQLPAEYGRAVAQRNAALRRVQAGSSTREALAPWSAAVVSLGEELDAARSDAVQALAQPFAEATAALGLEEGALAYDPAGLTAGQLERRLDRDLDRGTTGAGPHLCDVSVQARGRELRSFGSQGEQRLAVLALLLSEARLLLDRLDDPPLLLLDDVMSELDDGRRRTLVELLPSGCQTLVTATSDRSLPSGSELAEVIDVVPGRAAPR